MARKLGVGQDSADSTKVIVSVNLLLQASIPSGDNHTK